MAVVKETHKKKIILYYALIVIPCIILGILAFRGIRNDQALLEREQLRVLQETANNVIDKTSNRLDSIETEFIKLSEALVPPDQLLFLDSILNRFIKKESSISGIFFIDKNQVKLLNHGILYLRDNYFNSEIPDQPGNYQKIMEPGWKLEFREKRYIDAVNFYRNLLSGNKDKYLHGEVLNAIARNLKKQNNFKEALKTYEQILVDYPDYYIQNEIPLGLIALLETGKIQHSLGDTLEALETTQLLLKNLQNSRWNMSKSHFINSVSETKRIIENSKSGNDKNNARIESNYLLLDSISSLEKHTPYILDFREGVGPDIFSNLSFSGNQPVRFKYGINGENYLIAVSKHSEEKYLGLIYNQESILENTVIPLIEQHATTSEFEWKIENMKGEVLHRSDTLQHLDIFNQTSLPADLPAWSFLFYPHERSMLSSFLQTSEGIFFYIFVLIIIILAFGLFLIINAVNNEIKLSKLKSHFITTVSHEFKSPLASIRQMAEMLEHDRVPTAERKQKYYQGIVQQSERLSHLIENILNYSKMEEKQKVFQFQKADLVPMIEDVVESFENFMSVKGFNINYSKTGDIPEFCFDKEAMEQVLHNLLDNACKYSGNSKNIEVNLERKNEQVLISIKDYGLGIKKEDQDKIFNRFYRVGNELTQKVKGSGIGLTIVKQIVEAHEGKITVESEPDQGSTFFIALPLKRQI